MSIIALKKKAENNNPRLAPLSGKAPFSLNGSRRLSDNNGIPQKYNTCCLESNSIRPPIMNNRGMLNSKHKKYNNIVHTPTNVYTSQQQYIKDKSVKCHIKRSINEIKRENDIQKERLCNNNCKIFDSNGNLYRSGSTNSYFIGGSKIVTALFTKHLSETGAISASEYIKNICPNP